MLKKKNQKNAVAAVLHSDISTHIEELLNFNGKATNQNQSSGAEPSWNCVVKKRQYM